MVDVSQRAGPKGIKTRAIPPRDVLTDVSHRAPPSFGIRRSPLEIGSVQNNPRGSDVLVGGTEGPPRTYSGTFLVGLGGTSRPCGSN